MADYKTKLLRSRLLVASLQEILVFAIGDSCLACNRDCGSCLSDKAAWMPRAKAALSLSQKTVPLESSPESEVKNESQSPD